jgi:tetratricopeptide (TPR) repeat protein
VRAERELLDPLRAALTRSPIAPLLVAAIAVLVWALARSGGYYGTTWYPAALLLLGLLVVAAVAVPWVRPPALVVAAASAFAAYAAWSYLSIAWAGQKADAWDGANRSALYALAFALFALWRVRGRAAAGLLGAYALAVSTIAVVELVRALTLTNPAGLFLGGQFSAPAGYQNADVALWFSAFWPCVALGSRRAVPPLPRALLVAGAVALGGLALLPQSRGWAFAAPIATVAFIAIVPGRLRATLTLCLVVAADAACAPLLLHVYNTAGHPTFRASVRDASAALLIAAAAAGVATAAIAVVDRRVRIAPRYVRATGIALLVAGALAASAGLGVFIANEGSPVTVASKAWRSFKRTSTPRVGRSRFLQSLGSNRYDFWRVAWGRFTSHPIAGIGADNFQQAYLARRRSDEEPRYPHSVELRALSQTGIVGALLLAAAFGAALAAALRAIRLRAAFAGATVAGAAMVVGYWLIHGSVDWLWEFAGLGAAACAMLGLAAGMVPRAAAAATGSPAIVELMRAPARDERLHARRFPTRAAVTGIAAAALAAGLAATFTLPWSATLESDAALRSWRVDQRGAFDDLHTASSLNPLSPDPSLLAGTIALRLGRYADAARYFRRAIQRDDGEEYAHLELGVLLAQSGHRAQGVALLTRALKLNPRDGIARFARDRLRRGRPVSITAINDRIVRQAQDRLR